MQSVLKNVSCVGKKGDDFEALKTGRPLDRANGSCSVEPDFGAWVLRFPCVRCSSHLEGGLC